MEIAVNKRVRNFIGVGGFSLSPDGIREYFKQKGKEIYFYKRTKCSLYDGINEWSRVDNYKKGERCYKVTQYLGEVIYDFPNRNLMFCSWEIPRDDADLIKTLKKLKKKANGLEADIKIIEIPDGIEWVIEDDDGYETVVETVVKKHRSW